MRTIAFIGYDRADQLGVFYVDRQSEHLRESFRAILEGVGYSDSFEALLNELALDAASDLYHFEYVGYESWERRAVPEVPVELAHLAEPNELKKQLVMLTHVDFATAPTMLFDIEVGILGWNSAYSARLLRDVDGP